MNYRHHYHAGNFADVVKHVVLLQLIRALQRKEKGLLYLDTHAGRGSYDLGAAAQGDTLVRQPEWPNGIGRLWSKNPKTSAVAEYLALVRQFDLDRGNRQAESPKFYPGSPWMARLAARTQDRLALCEKQPGEFALLEAEFAFSPRTSVHAMDGYTAVRAMLPPVERRALVLIDPPFEAQDEFAAIIGALRDGLKRLSAATIAVWYPLTERARLDAFFNEARALVLPPTLLLELTLADARFGLRVPGCGLLVVNPPWQFEKIAEPALVELSEILMQAAGAAAHVQWLVPEN